MATGPNPEYPEGGGMLICGGWEWTGATGGGAVGGGGAAGVGGPFSTKFITSALVMRPPAPEPGTLFRSIPCSCATFLPTGLARTPSLPPAGCAAGLGAARADAAAGAAGADAGAPASSRRASAAPTGTTEPSLANCSTSTPEVGEGTSVLALSVAISTSGSSRSTRCPGRAIQRTTVPSTTDSPSWGITTVVMGKPVPPVGR